MAGMTCWAANPAGRLCLQGQAAGSEPSGYRAAVARHATHFQGSEQSRQALEFLQVHTGAGAPGVVQSPVIGVVAQPQRTDMWAASFWIRPPDDDKFLRD